MIEFIKGMQANEIAIAAAYCGVILTALIMMIKTNIEN